MGKPTTVAGLAMLDMLSDHAPWFLNGSERAEGQAIAAIEAEAYERGCVAGMAMERFAPTPPDALHVERLARAIAMTKGMEPGEMVETTKGDVSVLDYPDEWFDTPRAIAAAIAHEYAALAATEGEHVHEWEPTTTLDGWRCEDETCGATPGPHGV